MFSAPPLGEDSWKLVTGFLWTLLQAKSFPFTEDAHYPLAVINLSHEYEYMLSPVGPLSESLNLTVVCGASDTVGILILPAAQVAQRIK